MTPPGNLGQDASSSADMSDSLLSTCSEEFQVASSTKPPHKIKIQKQTSRPREHDGNFSA